MNTNPADYFESNKQLWNEKVPVHLRSAFYDQKKFLKTKNSLNKIELDGMPDLDGKSLLHLQCHFGQDSISLAKLGADVTAVDFSPVAIAEAKKIAQELDTSVRFLESNVLDVRDILHEEFDIVYTSYGTICWLPDLKPWAKVVVDSLKKGGIFYMVDFHPVLDMFEHADRSLAFHYFNLGVYEESSEGTYADTSADITSKQYFWNHHLGEIFDALLSTGLRLDCFSEHDYSPYNCFSNLVQRATKEYVFDVPISIPHVFELKFVKD